MQDRELRCQRRASDPVAAVGAAAAVGYTVSEPAEMVFLA